MKRIPFFISTLLLVTTLSFSNGSFAQDYVHYATLIGHTDLVLSISFSPDGKVLASGGTDTTIRLWDVVTGKHKKTLTGHTGWVSPVRFSPNGKTLASGSESPDIYLWNVDTGRHQETLIGHKDEVFSMAFSPDGKVLASGSWDGTILLWDTVTGQRKKTLRGHASVIYNVSFSPDGNTLVSGSSDRTIRLWDTNTGQHKKTLRGHTTDIWSISFSPDGKTLASGSSDKTIRLWDTNTGQHKKTLRGHTDRVTFVWYLPDGRTIASGSADGTVRLWNAFTGRQKTILMGKTDRVFSVRYSPDGKTIARLNLDGAILLWRVSPVYSANPNPNPHANQAYDNAIRSVMWMVNPGIGEGSGVLIDKKFRLAITNGHVIGTQNAIDVYFPAPDENGELIKDRNFYLKNNSVLKRLGYYTTGHVVAKDEKTDLAIIRLEGLPETAREIDWNFTTPTTNTSDLVYILGNPGGQNLWRWTLGEFLNDQSGFLHIQSDVFGGNSGGPVLNKQGVLLGIIARSDRYMNALAIPVKDINRLLSESQLKHSRSRR